MRRIALKIIIICSVIFMSCGNDSSDKNNDVQPPSSLKAYQLEKGTEITIPNGYTILDMSEFGRVLPSSTTYYLKQNSSDRIFAFRDGDFQYEITPPSGMALVGVCSFGEILGFVTYYCQDKTTGKIFKCNY